jgi:hypothetical protein
VYERLIANSCLPEFAGKVIMPEGDQRITNGSVAGRGQFPWQVGITINGASFFGGSVISNDWVLTDARSKCKTVTLATIISLFQETRKICKCHGQSILLLLGTHNGRFQSASEKR